MKRTLVSLFTLALSLTATSASANEVTMELWQQLKLHPIILQERD